MKMTQWSLSKKIMLRLMVYALVALVPCVTLAFFAYNTFYKYFSKEAVIGMIMLLVLVVLMTMLYIIHKRVMKLLIGIIDDILDTEDMQKYALDLSHISSFKELIEAVKQLYTIWKYELTQSNKKLEKINQELTRANEIIENSLVVIFEWPIPSDSPAIYVSKNIERFGYSAAQLLSGEIDFYDMIHPDDLERVKRTVKKARKINRSEYKYMYRILSPSGRIFWVEDYTIMFRDCNGKLISEKGILRDVTDEVKINDQMARSEVRYKELFDNANALIFTCDFTGNLTSANRTTLAILNKEAEDLEGLNLYKILDLDQNAVDISDLGFLETFLTEPYELKILDGDQMPRVLETRNSLLYKDDCPYEIQTTAIDITERKLAEAQVQYLTYHDRLTGLYNRLYFDMLMEEIETKGTRPVAIIIGDVNGLKLTNDAFGHKEGDRLLIELSLIMDEAIEGHEGLVARLSGDEFAIMLPGMGKIGAELICERIRQGCLNSKDISIKPSIALGYSSWDAESSTLEGVLIEAEDHMYHNKLNESKSIRSSIIQSLKATLEGKTTETREHAERIRTYGIRLGKRLGLEPSKLDELSLAAIMHDIGKIGIPDSILNKPGPLDEEEWLVMRKHPEIGYHIILSSPNMSKVAEFILAHHERWDGKGYPQGLRSENIPLLSRIIAVADSYDVMTSGRPYREALTVKAALLEIERNKGTQFDPEIAQSFIEMIQEEIC